MIRTIRNLEELDSVRSCWEAWQNYPNTDFDHYRLVCRLRSEVKGPLVVVTERSGKPCALLVARLERTQFQPRIGYLSPIRLPAQILRVLHQGSLGQMDVEVAEAVVRHLRSLLGAGVADAVTFQNLAEDSPMWRGLQTHGPRWLCERKPAWSKHWALALPSEPGFLLQRLRSKHRSWIRKKQKDLDADFQGKLSWQWPKHFDDLIGLGARLEAVAALTYQRGLGGGFVNDEDHRQRFALFARRGQLRVQLLEIEGQVRAFWIGAVYQNVFHSWATGYDPELRKYEVGTLIFIRMVDELVQEGIRRLDFGLGEAFYKERFGDESWDEATVHMFAPTAKGALLRSSLAASSILDRAGRRLFRQAGTIDRIRTFWRRRLARVPKMEGEEK